MLQGRDTWKPVLIQDIGNSTILLVIQVFTYKFDEDRWLEKYKARLVIHRDLYQNDQQETYVATLAVRVFRTLIAVATYFDLNIFQLDAVNTFMNVLLDEVVYIKIPQGYDIPEYCFELKRALYSLP